VRVAPAATPPTSVTLALADKPGAAAASLRRGWLGV
jgi:hypothetical protein